MIVIIMTCAIAGEATIAITSGMAYMTGIVMMLAIVIHTAFMIVTELTASMIVFVMTIMTDMAIATALISIIGTVCQSGVSVRLLAKLIDKACMVLVDR
jgi:hypothetical protein